MKPEGRLCLVRASWVFSERGWLEGGALVFDPEKGLVIDSGNPKDLSNKWALHSSKREYPGCALLPAMVNGHTHLELSAYPMIEAKDYFSWVRKLLMLRSQAKANRVAESFKEEFKKAGKEGTCLLGDITNIPILAENGQSLPKRHVFWELIGFNVNNLYDALTENQRLYFLEGKFTRAVSLVPHAVYSTSAGLISQTYRWCRSRGQPFTIHIGEHAEELEFMLTGRGACRELLEELGRWKQDWKPPGLRPVEYLESLKVLDKKTLLVHCTHFNDEDWRIVRSHGCYVCFCLRSNEFLGTGRPEIPRPYEMGIPVLFGTDSLASSPDLNMFREVAHILESYPELPPNRVLKSATFTAFRFFTGNTRMPYLLVYCDDPISGDEVSTEVIRKGIEGKIKWLQEDFGSEE